MQVVAEKKCERPIRSVKDQYIPSRASMHAITATLLYVRDHLLEYVAKDPRAERYQWIEYR